MPQNVTIRQVAQAAGVSVATVSGILNHSGRHSPATAAHVLAVMQDLGYVPRRNRLRRPPVEKNGRLQRVGLLFPDPHNRGTQTVLGHALHQGIQKALSEQNIQVSTHTLDANRELPSDLFAKQLDGLIVRGGSHTVDGDPGLHQQLQKKGIPMVWAFGSTSMAHLVDSVRMDDRSFGVLAADKVDPTKTQRIFIIKSPNKPNIDLEIRALSFQIHLYYRGITVEPTVLSLDDAQAAITRLHAPQNMTIFLSGHDEEIIKTHQSIIAEASAKGIAVDLIGVMTEEANFKPHPKQNIQILHIDPYRMGIAAGRQLLNRYKSPWADPTTILVPAKEISEAAAKARIAATEAQ